MRSCARALVRSCARALVRSCARALVRSCRAMYIVAIRAHAPVRWFHLMLNAWKAAIDLCCGSPCQLLVSYEKGEKKEKGHLQGITRIFTHESLKDKTRAWMRACLMLNTGMHRCKVGCAFFTGQEWEYMCGYVQKRLFVCMLPADRRTYVPYFVFLILVVHFLTSAG